MSQELFSGQWIQGENYDYGNEDELYYHNHPNTILYKSFNLEHVDKENIFRIAVLGYYVLSVNGKRVSIAELNNDWTDFTKCVYFDEYDITNYLNIGINEIEIELGNGMYNPSPLRLFGKYNLRQRLAEIGEPKAICELIVNQKTYLSSDSSWLYKPGYYLFNNLYLGEKIDYTMQSTQLFPVIISNQEYHFEKSFIPKIKKFQVVEPFETKEYHDGLLVDFGKMISGFISLNINTYANQEIKLEYSEDFRNGEMFYDTVLAGSVGEKINDFQIPGGPGAPERAIQTDVIKCNEGVTYFENKFTYHSFRYVYLTGCSLDQINKIEAIYVHTDLKQIGNIESEHELYNQLYEAAMQTKLNNVHSVFEDCARERLGYGGDIVALAMSNLYTFDLQAMYKKVIRDFRFEQSKNGGIPETAPYMGIQTNGTADREGPLLWQLVYPYLVNKHYQFYGDKSLLEEEIPYLKKHMDYILSLDLEYVVERCLGDHGSILIAGQFRKPTPDKLFLGYCTVLLLLKNNIQILNHLGLDSSFYKKQYDHINEIICNKFVHADGTVGEGTQTGYAFALYLELGNKEKILNKFIKKLEADNYIFNSGIFGMSLSYEVLSKNDRCDIVEKWLLNKNKGTFYEMLESGNGVLSELFVGDHFSMNHAMFTSYQVFYYKGLAGIYIDDDAIGFNKITLKPYFTHTMNHYSCSVDTIHGKIESTWNKTNNGYEWIIKVPDTIQYQLDLKGYHVKALKEQKEHIKVIFDE
jgi:alpha-L-rhamnosidase